MWGWIFSLALVSLCLLITLRVFKRRRQEYRYGGLLWLANKMSYWGPCCEACRIHSALRPTYRSSAGVQYYELVCPLCHATLTDRTFTLQALLEAKEQLATDLKRRPAGLALGSILSPPTAAKRPLQ